MFERIFDCPRIILPGPRYLFLGPGHSEKVVLVPQIPMYPPYWLGMIAMEELHVVEIRFGNEQVFGSTGAVPSYFFDVKKVECLIPINAKRLEPSEQVLIEVDNWSCASVQTSLTIWGSYAPDNDTHWNLDRPIKPFSTSRLESNLELPPALKTYWR